MVHPADIAETISPSVCKLGWYHEPLCLIWSPRGPQCQPVTLPTAAYGVQLVPVFSTSDVEDFKIRGYTKCPTYQKRLQHWYASEEFVAKAAATEQLRNEVQAAAPQLNTSLSNWWNVYDAFNVWKTYGVGDQMQPLSNVTYTKV